MDGEGPGRLSRWLGGGKALKRLTVVSLIAAVVFSGAPARADSVNGSILLPLVGSPAPSRILYSDLGRINGLVGYVFPLSDKDGSFTLRKTGGVTTLEDFDIFFYESISGLAAKPAGDAMCTSNSPTCTQQIPAKANYAVVTLTIGLAGTFSYTS